MLTLTTAGVKIDVLAKYEPGISSPVLNSFVFSYEISITNTNDFPVQLTRRFWDIFDSSGLKYEKFLALNQLKLISI